jgi:hypothetical protein
MPSTPRPRDLTARQGGQVFVNHRTPKGGGFSLDDSMANVKIRFANIREIGLRSLVRFLHSQKAVVPVYIGRAVISRRASGAASVCDRTSASPTVRPDRSGKAQTAEPFLFRPKDYHKKCASYVRRKPAVSALEVS